MGAGTRVLCRIVREYSAQFNLFDHVMFAEKVGAVDDDSDAVMLDDSVDAAAIESAVAAAMSSSAPQRSLYPPITADRVERDVSSIRLPIPPHRYTPLQRDWPSLYQPIVTHMRLATRVNTRLRAIELRTTDATHNADALTKAADFLRAYLLGFDVADAVALLRLDDLYVDSFDVSDVRIINGDHRSRAIGRVVGASGKTKFAIENATKTRIVVADSHIHILGAYQNILYAKSAVVRLILGAPPGKVYNTIRIAANKIKHSAT